MSSIKKNLGFQTLYQILNTCLPLITAPYLARVLGAEQLGVFSYTQSIVAYFLLVAMLGTVNYGTRSIAAKKDDRQERSKIFWSIYILQLIVAIVSLMVYIGYLLFVCNENMIIAAIQGITIIACLLDINWLFFGIENFQFTVTRNMIIKIITVISIILFVRKTTDLWLYTLIMVLGTLFSNLVLWVYLPKVVGRAKVSMEDIFSHIKPNLLLFVPLLAMSIYHTMDKTMLGLMSNYKESGYYYNADKIINIPVNVLSGVGTVLLPRISNMIGENKREEASKLFRYSLEGVVLISVAISFGIAAVSKEFVPVFFGEGYDACVLLIVVLSPVLIIKGFSLSARYQYLIPYNKDVVFIKSVVLGAILNVIINLLLIPRLGALGAVIGTIVAELSACVYQFHIIKKEVALKVTILNCCFYMLFGGIMLGIVRLVAFIPLNTVVALFTEILCGGIVFVVFCIIYWKKTHSQMYIEVFGGLLRKLHIKL